MGNNATLVERFPGMLVLDNEPYRSGQDVTLAVYSAAVAGELRGRLAASGGERDPSPETTAPPLHCLQHLLQPNFRVFLSPPMLTLLRLGHCKDAMVRVYGCMRAHVGSPPCLWAQHTHACV